METTGQQRASRDLLKHMLQWKDTPNTEIMSRQRKRAAQRRLVPHHRNTVGLSSLQILRNGRII